MSRIRPDSCPGAVVLHQAADGPLARIRLPGGMLRPEQLQLLAEAAHEVAAGTMELTSRGNIQLRAVHDATGLAARLATAGLLPTETHERVRNIVASPLSGRIGGSADIRDLVAALDEGLQSDSKFATLPGRVLFTLDDGRGDVSGQAGDIGLHAVDPEQFALLLAGIDSGIRVTTAQAVETVLAAAAAFADIRTDEWRLCEIADGSARVLERLGLEPTSEEVVRPQPASDPPIGWLAQDNGLVALGAGLRFGSLSARTAEFLAAVERPLIVTPWRTVVLCDLQEWAAEQVVRVLAPQGLIFDAESPWLRISACAGRPGCASALADVRADAATAVAVGIPGDIRMHWSGCARRCGRPRSGNVLDKIAGEPGYLGETNSGKT